MIFGKQIEWDYVKWRNPVHFSNEMRQMDPVFASIVQISLKLIMWETIQEFSLSLVFSLIQVAQSSLWSDCLNCFTDVKKRSAKSKAASLSTGL